MEWYQKFDCSAMAFNPPIPPPKPMDLKKTIKGRFTYFYDDIESTVNKSLATTIQSDGHLLDFYRDFRINSSRNQN